MPDVHAHNDVALLAIATKVPFTDEDAEQKAHCHGIELIFA